MSIFLFFIAKKIALISEEKDQQSIFENPLPWPFSDPKAPNTVVSD
jgi:hypothetical protein